MPRPLKRVSKAELRRLFKLTERIDRENPIPERKCKKLAMPKGSWSQMVAYDDAQGVQIVLAHQYVRPDGRIRAGSKPDPKYILIDGVIHCPHPEPPAA